MQTKQVNRFLTLKRIDAPKINLDSRKAEFKEIYTQLASTAIEHQADRCLDCGNPYCQWKCPVHNYIPQWLKLAYDGRIIEAAELSHQTNTFPEICGRICPQDRLCEGSCTLEDGFGAVSIGNIERYITDEAFKQGWQPTYHPITKKNKKVAVIGAGPAGLACADVLNQNGIDVMVFDRQGEIGGLLTFGIPAFKLEKQIIRHRHKLFLERGIKFQLNTEIGKDVQFEKILADYDAVFISAGTYKPVSDRALTDNLKGVLQSLDFLTAVNSDLLNGAEVQLRKTIAGKRVVVLGGGDTSMDCIRTSIRLGAASVTGVYRRGQSEMPGSTREFDNACEEGAKFVFHAQPIALLGENNQLSRVKFMRNKIDSDVHKSVMAHSEFAIEADIVIIAFGFTPENLPWLEQNNIDIDDKQRIRVNQDTLQSSNPRVFAGGDLVRGASLVVYAIADGMKSAREINAFLS